ncbi:MAG: hypothetical protein A2289_14715 [Deltaproteobacteria bacterium RIFOXYA12_FULL_58_15]|nr:MAG: hypothetical protein A2289_14715 [Deltaproteobacteria bacterium RIFOXYA12_FULL_58_15]
MVDYSRLITVVVVMVGICAVGGLVLAAPLWQRLRRHMGIGVLAPRPSRWWCHLRATLLGAIVLIVGIGMYGRFVEPYWPEVVEIGLTSDELGKGALPIRIVLLSDLHSDPQTRLEARLSDLVAPLEPDLIIFAGDAVNSEGGLPNFRKAMTGLRKIAPVYAVRGNWEAWWFSKVDLYHHTGVRLLDGSRSVDIRGTTLHLAGFPVYPWRNRPGGAAYQRALERTLPEHTKGPVVFVHHFPEVAAAALLRGADIALAGDTHGGQIDLPGIGPLVRINRAGTFYHSGLHEIADGWLYVNRGTGMEGGHAPRVRIGCRPEITLITLRPPD